MASKANACQTFFKHLCRENILRKKGEYDSHFSGDWCSWFVGINPNETTNPNHMSKVSAQNGN
ncbi:TPA: hypothetical protein ACKW2Q_002793 [Staphylococcus aureus]